MDFDLSNPSPTLVWTVLTLFIIGVVELIKRIGEARDPMLEKSTWTPVWIIVGAALAGAIALPVFGNFFPGFTLFQLSVIGMVLGFNASGAISALSYLGKKTSPPVEVMIPSANTVNVVEQPLLETTDDTSVSVETNTE